MPSFGLTFLSRSALRKAEQLMLGDKAGVRDEVGFLLVHQRYADRFFPGTSVLHTRLRYAMFVPWLLERVRTAGGRGRGFLEALKVEETALARRLKDGGGSGVIGRLMLPEASNQPPSYVYWTALATWGLIDRKPNGRAWSRADLGALAATTRAGGLRDDDGRPLETAVWPVAPLPDPPGDWDDEGPLSFDLAPAEKLHLAKLIRAVPCPADAGQPSVLAMLAGRSLEAASCWDAEVLDAAHPHRRPLRRAGRAASLAAVGRGVYAALVERQKERDGRAAGRLHREALIDVLDRHADKAAGLDPDQLVADMGSDLPKRVEDVLRETLGWVRRGAGDPDDLLATYRRSETRRKGPRARLADDQRGVDRRIEWTADGHPAAEPLHYRWDRVSTLLADLAGA